LPPFRPGATVSAHPLPGRLQPTGPELDLDPQGIPAYTGISRTRLRAVQKEPEHRRMTVRNVPARRRQSTLNTCPVRPLQRHDHEELEMVLERLRGRRYEQKKG